MSRSARPRARVEDWHGRYWWSDQGELWLLCSDQNCLIPVRIVRDVLDRWFARHDVWDWQEPRSRSSVTSPRFEHWQEAAAWAVDRGLVSLVGCW